MRPTLKAYMFFIIRVALSTDVVNPPMNLQLCLNQATLGIQFLSAFLCPVFLVIQISPNIPQPESPACVLVLHSGPHLLTKEANEVSSEMHSHYYNQNTFGKSVYLKASSANYLYLRTSYTIGQLHPLSVGPYVHQKFFSLNLWLGLSDIVKVLDFFRNK